MDRPQLPTQQEVHRLPRWAKVALAARCARRVVPLFRAYWPHSPTESINALVDAIALAERSAQGDQDALDEVYTASEQIDYFRQMAERVHYAAYYAAHAGWQAAVAAAMSPHGLDPESSFFAISASNQAIWVAAPYSQPRELVMVHFKDKLACTEIRDDYDLIRQTAEGEFWSDNTCVPKDFFGPLSPIKPLPWWPTIKGY